MRGRCGGAHQACLTPRLRAWTCLGVVGLGSINSNAMCDDKRVTREGSNPLRDRPCPYYFKFGLNCGCSITIYAPKPPIIPSTILP